MAAQTFTAPRELPVFLANGLGVSGKQIFMWNRDRVAVQYVQVVIQEVYQNEAFQTNLNNPVHSHVPQIGI